MNSALKIIILLLLAGNSAYSSSACVDLLKRPLINNSVEFTTELVTLRPQDMKNAEGIEHSHPHAEFLFVSSGKGVLEINGSSLKIGAGQFLYIPPLTSHRFTQIVNQLEFFQGYDVPLEQVLWLPAKNSISQVPPFIRHTNKMKWRQWDPEHPVYTKFMLDGTQPIRSTVTAGLGQIPPGKDLAHHYHKEAEYYVILKGEGVMYLEGKVHDLYPGKIIYVPGNAFHQTLNTGSKSLEFFFLFKEPEFSKVHYHFAPNHWLLKNKN